MKKILQLTILRGPVILQTEKPARELAHLFHRMDSTGLENSAGLGYQTRHQDIDYPSHRLTDPQFLSRLRVLFLNLSIEGAKELHLLTI